MEEPTFAEADGRVGERSTGLPPPDVTVVLPTRDRWSLLSRALASVFAQEAVTLEVVVVDEDSTDETPRELARIADERLRVVRNSPARGVARARNRGIDEALGSWTAFLDDDDVWAPHKLRTQLEAAARPEVDVVYAGAVVIDGDGAVKRFALSPESDQLDSSLLLSNAIGTPSSVIAKTSTLQRLGGFDERLAVLADWDLWLRIASPGRAVAVHEPLIAYLEHAENMHLSRLADIEVERRHMTRKHRALLREHGARLGGLDFSRWLVGQYRSNGRRLDASREYARIGIRHRKLRDLGRAGGILLGEGVMKLGPRQRPDPVVHVDLTPPPWLEAALEARV
jgi:glycosyltransferase involved in cell wall biosynthesis